MNDIMDSSLTIIETSAVSPPPSATLRHQSLPFTIFDFDWLISFPHPTHTLFFYHLPITKSHFIQTTIPTLKTSLSTTLQHFLPFSGHVAIFPTKKPELRYVVGDSVAVTFSESTNLDFGYLTGNHPRDCDKFYPLVPLLGPTRKVSDYVAINSFAVQVTLFPDVGICVGMTNHHCLGDASTRFMFLNAWTSVARSGSDDSFLAHGTLPVYERVVGDFELEERFTKKVKVESFGEGFQVPKLCGPSGKVRATFVLARTVVNGLKKLVSTQVPTLEYVSSFTVTCAYVWSCRASMHVDELSAFGFVIDCRSRMDPPLPAAYFGNCIVPCVNLARISAITGKDGFVKAAKLIGENLHKMLTDKDGMVKHMVPVMDMFPDGLPTLGYGVAGTPKLKFYDLDFGFGKPIKHETVSIDFGGSISISASKDSSEDFEIGLCLSGPDMEAFGTIFNDGLKSYL